jgi:short/branched chain acyl-CoA dehydrogenase
MSIAATETARRTVMGTDQLVDAVPWSFNEEHLEWRKIVRHFCSEMVAPGAVQRSIDGHFDPDLVRRAGQLGIMGLLVPEEYGGSGADLTSLCIAIEELAAVDSSLAVTVHVQAISAALLHRLADHDQKADLLPRAARGEAFVAFGLTEPSGGSDAGNMATRAERDGDEWVINGAKQFITNSGTPFSQAIILFAATGSGRPGRPEISAFLVPLDAPGVTIGAPYPKMGWRSSDTHPLFFDDVRVPARALLRAQGRGYGEALQFLTWARIPIAAMSTGLARGCLDATVDFVRSRSSFGKELAAHQAVAFTVADIASMVATAKILTYDAAWRYDNGHPIEQHAAMCKLVASELANQAAYKATQLHGGYGFIDESDVARHYRDARILTIGEGTSEIQRMLIARSLGLPV